MIGRKQFKIFAIVVIIIATFKLADIIPKQDELHIHSLTLFPPDRRESKQPLVFLHIGKTGGTSFDDVMSRVAKDLDRKYFGRCHFDWSYIAKNFGLDASVLTIFRHPVDRSISNFHFSKRCAWTEGMKIRNQTMEEYLNDLDSMQGTREIWMDGQAGVMWLSGLHTGKWVHIPPSEIEEREKRFLETKLVAELVIERMLNTTWFGVLDDLDRSMEMLSATLGRSVQMAKKNSNQHKDENNEVRKKLADLMPFDLWMYDFALKVFEARWKHYLGHKDVKVPLPRNLPEMKCTSTKTTFFCKKAELMGSFIHKRIQNTNINTTNKVRVKHCHYHNMYHE